MWRSMAKVQHRRNEGRKHLALVVCSGGCRCHFGGMRNSDPQPQSSAFKMSPEFPDEIRFWKPLAPKLPVSMMIYCSECGKHFDIVVTAKGSRKYRCPACGKVQSFDLDSFTNKAVDQSIRMFGTGRRGRGL